MTFHVAFNLLDIDSVGWVASMDFIADKVSIDTDNDRFIRILIDLEQGTMGSYRCCYFGQLFRPDNSYCKQIRVGNKRQRISTPTLLSSLTGYCMLPIIKREAATAFTSFVFANLSVAVVVLV